jgi:hypothetical protein
MIKVTKQSAAIIGCCKFRPVHDFPLNPPKGGHRCMLATLGVHKQPGKRQRPCQVVFVSEETRDGAGASQVGSAALGGLIWICSFALGIGFEKISKSV